MIFKHRETEKEALWVNDTPYGKDWIEINSWEDLRDMNLPDMFWSSTFNMPPEIEHHGYKSLLSYLKAFFTPSPETLYFLFIPSNFPDGKLPQGLSQTT